MPSKKGTSTPNMPLDNPTWTLDEGEEMRRDINYLQNKIGRASCRERVLYRV